MISLDIAGFNKQVKYVRYRAYNSLIKHVDVKAKIVIGLGYKVFINIQILLRGQDLNGATFKTGFGFQLNNASRFWDIYKYLSHL